ncbi:hypothetical protein ES705_09413 [subsurface metagenome]
MKNKEPAGTKKPDAVKQHNNSIGKKKPTPASWKPGQSGNPFGRPTVRNSLAETFRVYLDGRDKSGRIRKKLLIERIFALTDGTGAAVSAARLICDMVANFEIEERVTRLEERVSELAPPRIGLHEYRR